MFHRRTVQQKGVAMDNIHLSHFRHLILKQICDVLNSTYGEPLETLPHHKSVRTNEAYAVNGECLDALIDDIDENELEYFLAFKGDARLVDLQNALHRIRQGDYGKCIICKTEIDVNELEQAPTTRICSACVRRLTGGTLYPQQA